jgi:DUF2892 family protein
MGSLDRGARFLFALLVAGLYFTNRISGLFALILGVIAAVFLVTSFTGSCPLYTVLGLSTRRSEHPTPAKP